MKDQIKSSMINSLEGKKFDVIKSDEDALSVFIDYMNDVYQNSDCDSFNAIAEMVYSLLGETLMSLVKFKSEEVAIYFGCPHCDDEQVDVYPARYAKEYLAELQEHHCLIVHEICTRCGHCCKLLDPDFVQEIVPASEL